MTIQLSDAVRNARLDAIESAIGTAAKLQIRTGAPPATCAAADSGTLLAEITCPSDYLATASAGSKALAGTWQVNAAVAGIAGHFRLKSSAGSATGLQGTITATGGGGDMTLDNTNIAAGQVVTITAFTLTDGNA